MKRYQDSIRYFNFNKINEFKNIILQILLFTLYLNFKLNYFHNDLHLNNVLYENDNKKFIVNLENVMLKVLKNKIKVIDWEHSDKKFIKKTVVYQKISKYFNDNLPDFEFIYLLISIISNFTIIDNKVVSNSYKSFEMNNYKKNMILKLIKILKNKYTLGSFINLYQYIDLNFYDIFSIN